jgi:hypothetical protein
MNTLEDRWISGMDNDRFGGIPDNPFDPDDDDDGDDEDED